MTYLIERDFRGRTESVVDVPRFVADLAPLIGGTVIPSESDNDHTFYVRVGGLMLHVYGGQHTNRCRLDQVHVSCAVADVPPGDRPRYDGTGRYSMPSVNVSATKSIGVIARDITKRVIDAAAEPLAAIHAYVRQQQESREGLGQVLEELRVKVPELRERESSDSYERRLDWIPNNVYLQACAYASGQVGIDRIGNVSLEAFVEIADVLRRHSKREG